MDSWLISYHRSLYTLLVLAFALLSLTALGNASSSPLHKTFTLRPCDKLDSKDGKNRLDLEIFLVDHNALQSYNKGSGEFTSPAYRELLLSWMLRHLDSTKPRCVVLMHLDGAKEEAITTTLPEGCSTTNLPGGEIGKDPSNITRFAELLRGSPRFCSLPSPTSHRRLLGSLDRLYRYFQHVGDRKGRSCPATHVHILFGSNADARGEFPGDRAADAFRQFRSLHGDCLAKTQILVEDTVMGRSEQEHLFEGTALNETSLQSGAGMFCRNSIFERPSQDAQGHLHIIAVDSPYQISRPLDAKLLELLRKSILPKINTALAPRDLVAVIVFDARAQTRFMFHAVVDLTGDFNDLTNQFLRARPQPKAQPEDLVSPEVLKISDEFKQRSLWLVTNGSDFVADSIFARLRNVETRRLLPKCWSPPGAKTQTLANIKRIFGDRSIAEVDCPR